MKSIKKAVAVMLSIILAVVFCPCVTLKTAAAEDTVYIGIKGEINYDYAYEVLNILNDLRSGLGLAPLVMDEALLNDATLRAAETSIYFSHTRPNGESCFTALSESASAYGENIASGQGSPEAVMNSWENSSGHYANMTDSGYSSVGIGCFKSTNGVLCWVQLFSSKKSSGTEKSGTNTAGYTIEAKTENLSLTLSADKNLHTLENGDAFEMSLVNTNTGFTYVKQKIENMSLNYLSSDTGIIEFTDGNGTVTGSGECTVKVTSKENNSLIISADYTVGHIYSNSCDTTCNTCGDTRSITHSYTSATCTEAETCNVCGDIREAALGHKYSSAWDTFCDRCGDDRVLTYVPGDLDEDGDVNTSDLACMKLFLAGIAELSDTGLLAADLDADTSVTTTDLATLKLHLAGVTASP